MMLKIGERLRVVRLDKFGHMKSNRYKIGDIVTIYTISIDHPSKFIASPNDNYWMYLECFSRAEAISHLPDYL